MKYAWWFLPYHLEWTDTKLKYLLEVGEQEGGRGGGGGGGGRMSEGERSSLRRMTERLEGQRREWSGRQGGGGEGLIGEGDKLDFWSRLITHNSLNKTWWRVCTRQATRFIYWHGPMLHQGHTTMKLYDRLIKTKRLKEEGVRKGGGGVWMERGISEWPCWWRNMDHHKKVWWMWIVWAYILLVCRRNPVRRHWYHFHFMRKRDSEVIVGLS